MNPNRRIRWGIQTSYILRENLPYVEEWLAWHSHLGASFFYLYDNSGSEQLENNNAVTVNGLTKYGYQLDTKLSEGECLEIERRIFAKYPVVKIAWQPRQNGHIVWGQIEACDHAAALIQNGWCAFIDMDEFIVPEVPLTELLWGSSIIMQQRRFANRSHYRRALECDLCFDIDTRYWGVKQIINIADYSSAEVRYDIHQLKCNGIVSRIRPEQLCFNHYNHNPVCHEWLLGNYLFLDKKWQPKPFADIFDKRCTLARDRARALINYDDFEEVPMQLPKLAV